MSNNRIRGHITILLHSIYISYKPKWLIVRASNLGLLALEVGLCHLVHFSLSVICLSTMACGLEFLKRKIYQQAQCLQDLHPHLDKYLLQLHVNIHGLLVFLFKIGVIFLFIASIDADLSFNTYTLNTIKVDMTI